MKSKDPRQLVFTKSGILFLITLIAHAYTRYMGDLSGLLLFTQ
ncbi:biliverdin-producing heme oxygenase [Nostoc sp. 'Peltigera membranacea cyanobiont' 210A]